MIRRGHSAARTTRGLSSTTLLSATVVALGLSVAAYADYIHIPHNWRLFGMGPLPDLYEAGIEEIQDGLKKKRFTSVDLVKVSVLLGAVNSCADGTNIASQAYLARIEEVNLKGPALRAVLETNPSALEQAAQLDKERETSGPRGPLHGIPILLKDNIATLSSEGMQTTAGSYALLGAVVDGEASVAAKLRAAGALLLGKCSLSEWANWRGTVPSGFCGRGGQGTNPYVPLGNPSGSSSGSGIAGAVGLAAGTLGTETDGSIVSPSSHCNLVGLKPTVGLTSRAGVIPISEHQDSVGPMCRTVADCALVLGAIAGRDPRDNYTLGQPARVPDYTRALRADGLRGVRLGVPRRALAGVDAHVLAAFEGALADVRTLGAAVVDPADFADGWDADAVWAREEVVLRADFRAGVHAYLARLLRVPTGVRTVADLVRFNEENREKELVEPYWTDQSTCARFVKSNDARQDTEFWDALAYDYRMGRQDGIDGLLKKYEVDAILMPTVKASRPAAVAGYPVITVPLGFQPPGVALAEANPTRMNGPNMPFGISFLGTAYSEFQLIQYAYAYEQATKHRLEKKAYPEAIPKTQLADVMDK
ncbi:amidase signature enzyme [Daedalea quercina L-15889]|uniref:Amidase signature enzyme n=1 Tax=Daedalea quercina L-15889 TaxID=1314783 RepID=A0A165LC69_9APHY|nr:amidase signature enzyme [Daedalea quercina L-15889]